MRRKINPQPELDLYRSNLNLTNQCYEKYEAVSRILEQNPKILDLVHKDLKGICLPCFWSYELRFSRENAVATLSTTEHKACLGAA